MRRWARALSLACALLALAAPEALAHGGNADYRSVVDRVTPSVPGVEVEVLNYDAEMALTVPEGHRATVYGYEDEPYTRVLADGTVQVNERSAATYLNEDRYAEAKVPGIVDPEAPPRWRTVGGSGRFVWHDHRMHYMAEGVAPQVKDESRRTKVFDYEVPIASDGRPGAIAGTLFWVGPEDTSKLPFFLAGAAIVLGGGALLLFVRRRRDRDEQGDAEAGGGEGGEAW
jgi:hypothetical protein